MLSELDSSLRRSCCITLLRRRDLGDHLVEFVLHEVVLKATTKRCRLVMALTPWADRGVSNRLTLLLRLGLMDASWRLGAECKGARVDMIGLDLGLVGVFLSVTLQNLAASADFDQV